MMPSAAIQTRLLLLCRGALDWTHAQDGDPPLSPDGAQDAELAAVALPRFDAIVASPQRSSQETVEAVLARRQAPVVWQDGLDEIRPAVPCTDAAAYTAWLDRLFAGGGSTGDGESLADGAQRLGAAIRAIADRYYGRTTLVVSHPVILLAFRGGILHTSVERDQVESLPPLALSILDYLEGRFYLVRDFPTRVP
jgi:broad specificity phosphatase PhoE